ncbi:MAG TPA: hypothetical protein VNA25_30280 [Phycisphaerae bacterium]|nr:hypothetical protein [Phycisphaerae bacterium]
MRPKTITAYLEDGEIIEIKVSALAWVGLMALDCFVNLKLIRESTMRRLGGWWFARTVKVIETDG